MQAMVYRGEGARARAAGEEAVVLARELADPGLLLRALWTLGATAFYEGDLEDARAAFEEAVVWGEKSGIRHMTASPLRVLGNIALRRGDLGTARRLLEQSIGLLRELGNDANVWESLAGLGRVALAEGRLPEAVALFREMLMIADTSGSLNALPLAVSGLAAVAMARGQLGRLGIGSDDLICVCVPLLVHAAVSGDGQPAVPLAVALTLLYLGIDLWDEVMDDEVGPRWGDHRAAEVSLAAATLCTALAPLALAEVDAPPATLLAMQRTMSRYLLAMSAGQQTDLLLAESGEATTAVAEEAAAGRSGAAVAMFAVMAAQLAGAPAQVVADYAAMGCALGVAQQIRSDCADLFMEPHSRDLASGARTLPIALALERLVGQERAALLALLNRARTDAPAQEEVRVRLHNVGVVRACAGLVEIYCQRARDALARATPREPAGAALRQLIGMSSFFEHDPARATTGGGVT